MRKALIAMVATLAATASVFAAEMQTGVESIDFDARAIVLSNGETLTVAEGVDFSSIEAGDIVNIITDDATGEITEIMIAE